MTTHVGESDELERRLVQALEAVPEIAIPDSFAARVGGLVPASVSAAGWKMPTTSVGVRVAWAMLAVLAVFMLALAPAGVGGIGRWVEFALGLEFATLAGWLSLRRMLRS